MPTDLADELELVVTGGVNDVRYIEFVPHMLVSSVEFFHVASA